jgi:glycosyltransferase involved in cell wall biosynthesis
LAGQVRTLGYVPQEDLPVLYSGASLMAYPSLYEGFGLPPLEAMGCGCPVLTSNVSSLPEVVGDAAVTVNPLDEVSLSNAMKDILQDSAARERMKIQGIQRAKLFSWDRCAKLTLEAYYKALQILA